MAAVLLGSTSEGATADWINSCASWKFTALRSGKLGKIFAHTKVTNPEATVTRLGIYSDNGAGTDPNALLGYADVTVNEGGSGIQEADLSASGIHLVAGTTYWLHVDENSGHFDFEGTSSAGAYRELAGQHLPNPWTGGAFSGGVRFAIWGEAAGPSIVGTPIEINSAGASGSQSVAVPADASAAIVFATGWYPDAGYLSNGVVTLGGDAMTVPYPGDLDTGYFMGSIFWKPNPATGTQTLAWDWEGTPTPTSGVLIVVIFLTGTDEGGSAIRDGFQSQGTQTSYPTDSMTAQSGDLIVAFGWQYNDGPRTFSWTNATKVADFKVASGGYRDASCSLAFDAPTGNRVVTFGSGTLTDGGMSAIVIKAAVTEYGRPEADVTEGGWMREGEVAALRSNSFEGGTNAAQITTGNSGGASGDAWSAITDPGAAITYDNAVARETLSAKFTMAATAVATDLRWTGLGPFTTDFWIRVYLYLVQYPTGTNFSFLRPVDPSLVRCCEIGYSGAGQIRVYDAAGTEDTSMRSSLVVPIGQWVRLEARVRPSTTVGEVETRLYLNPDSDAISDMKLATGKAFTANIGGLRTGVNSTPANVNSHTWRIDDLAVSTNGWIGQAKRLFTGLDETSGDDSDYVESGLLTSTPDVLEVRLSDITP